MQSKLIKTIKNFIVLIFLPALIFWSFFGYYYDIIYFKHNKNINNYVEEINIEELKEAIQNDM
jgi:hypothetical protein